MKASGRLRFIALFLALSFIYEQVAFAAPDFASLAALPAKPSVPAFSDSVALVDTRLSGDNGLAVYLIQTAHTNDSAQANIARIAEQLYREENISAIYIEGAQGDVSLAFLRPKASPAKRREVARSFLMQGELNGVEYLDLASDLPLRLRGVEDASLYDRSLAAYGAVAKERERFQPWLDRLRAASEAAKPFRYNPSLLAFDRMRQEHSAGRVPLAEYFASLASLAPKHGIALKYYPELERLSGIAALEKSVDFKEAQKEQLRAFEALSAEERKELLGGGPAEFGKTPGDVKRLHAIAAYLAERNDDFRGMPALAKYRAYLNELRRLDSSRAVAELELLEREFYRKLFRAREEEEFCRADEAVRHLAKMAALTMTPDEFSAYRRYFKDRSAAELAGYLNRAIAESDQNFDKVVSWDESFAQFVRHAEEFYELTFERDRIFVRNILEDMRQGGRKKAAFLAGGYHAPNLKRLLENEGAAYVSILPQMTKETNLKRYEKILFRRAQAAAAPARNDSLMELRAAVTDGELIGRIGARLTEGRRDSAALFGKTQLVREEEARPAGWMYHLRALREDLSQYWRDWPGGKKPYVHLTPNPNETDSSRGGWLATEERASNFTRFRVISIALAALMLGGGGMYWLVKSTVINPLEQKLIDNARLLGRARVDLRLSEASIPAQIRLGELRQLLRLHLQNWYVSFDKEGKITRFVYPAEIQPAIDEGILVLNVSVAGDGVGTPNRDGLVGLQLPIAPGADLRLDISANIPVKSSSDTIGRVSQSVIETVIPLDPSLFDTSGNLRQGITVYADGIVQQGGARLAGAEAIAGDVAGKIRALIAGQEAAENSQLFGMVSIQWPQRSSNTPIPTLALNDVDADPNNSVLAEFLLKELTGILDPEGLARAQMAYKIDIESYGESDYFLTLRLAAPQPAGGSTSGARLAEFEVKEGHEVWVNGRLAGSVNSVNKETQAFDKLQAVDDLADAIIGLSAGSVGVRYQGERGREFGVIRVRGAAGQEDVPLTPSLDAQALVDAIRRVAGGRLAETDMRRLLEIAGLTRDGKLTTGDLQEITRLVDAYNVKAGGLLELQSKLADQGKELRFAKSTPVADVSSEDIQDYLTAVRAGKKNTIIFSAGRATRMKLPAAFDALGIGGLTPALLRRIEFLRKGREFTPQDELMADSEIARLLDRARNGIVENPDDLSINQRILLQYRYQMHRFLGPGSIQNPVARAHFTFVVNESNIHTTARQLATIGFAAMKHSNIFLLLEPEVGALEMKPDGELVRNEQYRYPEGHGDPFIGIRKNPDTAFTLNARGEVVPLNRTLQAEWRSRGIERSVFAQINDLHLLRDAAGVSRWKTADALMDGGSQMVAEQVENRIGQKGGVTLEDLRENAFMRDSLAAKDPKLQAVAIPDEISRMFYFVTTDGFDNVDYDSMPAYISVRSVDGKIFFTREYYSGDATSSFQKSRTIVEPGFELFTMKQQDRIPTGLGAVADQDKQPGFWGEASALAGARLRAVFVHPESGGIWTGNNVLLSIQDLSDDARAQRGLRGWQGRGLLPDASIVTLSVRNGVVSFSRGPNYAERPGKKLPSPVSVADLGALAEALTKLNADFLPKETLGLAGKGARLAASVKVPEERKIVSLNIPTRLEVTLEDTTFFVGGGTLTQVSSSPRPGNPYLQMRYTLQNAAGAQRSFSVSLTRDGVLTGFRQDLVPADTEKGGPFSLWYEWFLDRVEKPWTREGLETGARLTAVLEPPTAREAKLADYLIKVIPEIVEATDVNAPLTPEERAAVIRFVVRAWLAAGPADREKIRPFLSDAGLFLLAAHLSDGDGLVISAKSLDGKISETLASLSAAELQNYEADFRAEKPSDQTAKRRAQELIAFGKLAFMNAQMATPAKIGEAAPDAFEIGLANLKNVEDLVLFEALVRWRAAWASKFLMTTGRSFADFDIYFSGEKSLSPEQLGIVKTVVAATKNNRLHVAEVPESKSLVVRALDKDTLNARGRDEKSVYLSIGEADGDSFESITWLLPYGFSLGQVYAKHADENGVRYDDVKAQEADQIAQTYLEPFNRRLSGAKIAIDQIGDLFDLLSGVRPNLFSIYILSLMGVEKIDYDAKIEGARLAVELIGSAA